MNYLLRNIIYWTYQYLKEGPFESVNRNNHMNCFGNSIENSLLGTDNPAANSENKGKKASGTLCDVELILSTVCAEFQLTAKTSSQKIDILRHIEKIIRNLRFKFLKDPSPNFADLGIRLDQDHIDAILVDFLNYVGGRMGVDYAMYTYCLEDDRSKILKGV